MKRLNTQGCLSYDRRRLFVCEALAGQRVRIESMDKQLLVSFRDMYVREIDVDLGRTRALVLPRSHHHV